MSRKRFSWVCGVGVLSAAALVLVSCCEEQKPPAAKEKKGPKAAKEVKPAAKPAAAAEVPRAAVRKAQAAPVPQPLPKSAPVIIPTPKESKWPGKAGRLGGARIVLCGSDPKLKVAADEINQRLANELLAPQIKVFSGGLPKIKSAEGITIAIGVSGSPAFRAVEDAYPVAVPRKTEGYGIAFHRTGGKTVAVLAGHDAQGALYAAVTLRRMLTPAGGPSAPADGSAVLHHATIKDWPDFRWREIGGRPSIHRGGWYSLKSAYGKGDDEKGRRYEKEFMEAQSAYADYLLRHKINMSEMNQPGRNTVPKARAAAMRLNEYARARGVEYFTYDNTLVGSYPNDKDDPDISRCVDYRTHNRYFCWSLLDRHRERARDLAKYMKESGYRWIYLHDTDGGSWEDPGKWSLRCKWCREMYGDDHAKADITMFGLYYEEVLKLVPEAVMVAVVYPYSLISVDPDYIERDIVSKSGPIPNARAVAEKVAKRNADMLRRIGQGFDPRIKICLREGTRPLYDAFTDIYGDRDFQMYMEFEGAGARTWRPNFSMATGWAKTYYRPGHEDIFFPRHEQYGYGVMSELAAAEFGWNTNAPGSMDFPGHAVRNQDVEHHVQPEEEMRDLVTRLCIDYYGPEIGPHMVACYDSNISFNYIARPVDSVQRMKLSDPVGRMVQMEKATVRAVRSLAKARAAYRKATNEGRRPIPDPLAEKMFGTYCRYMVCACPAAAFRARMMQAHEAVVSGEMEKAEKLIRQARNIIGAGKDRWGEWQAWLKRIPSFGRPGNKNWCFQYWPLYAFDPKPFEEELAKFDKEKDAVFEAYNTPSWFKKAMGRRRLYAVRTSRPPAIDGKLDETAWASAPANEYFVNYKTSTPAQKETVVRILWDQSALYLGYTIYEPRADRVRVKKDTRDQVNREHSVEFFADVNSDKESYIQFMWDIAGQVLDGKTSRDANNLLKIDAGGFTSSAEWAVGKYRDRWVLEAKIPAADLMGTPKRGAVWRGHAARNLVRKDGKIESVSTSLFEGSGFHTPAKFGEIEFLGRAPAERKPVVKFYCRDATFAGVTITTGAGAEVKANVILETNKPLHNVKVVGEAFCGDRRRGEIKLLESDTLQLIWRTRKPFRYLSDTPDPGIEMLFHVTADEGEWTFRRVFGQPPMRTLPEPEYVPGVAGTAIAAPVHFPARLEDGTRLFDSTQGTVEMWVKPVLPLSPELRFGLTRERTLFCQCSVRFEHPWLTNWMSVAAKVERGWLTANITTGDWQQFSKSMGLRGFDDGRWHHVAMQWDVRGDREPKMDVYLDGRKVDVRPSLRLQEKKWKKVMRDFPVQLGAMVTGYNPLDWAYDEVRVSRAARYKDNFTPQEVPAVDKDTLVVFHFDGSLRGERPDGKKVTAVPGPAR